MDPWKVGKVYTSTFGTYGTAPVHERLLRLPEFIARRDADPHSTRMGEPSNDNDTMLLGGQPAALAVALQGFGRLEVAAASARAVADGLLRRDVGALVDALRAERARSAQLADDFAAARSRWRREAKRRARVVEELVAENDSLAERLEAAVDEVRRLRKAAAAADAAAPEAAAGRRRSGRRRRA